MPLRFMRTPVTRPPSYTSSSTAARASAAPPVDSMMGTAALAIMEDPPTWERVSRRWARERVHSAAQDTEATVPGSTLHHRNGSSTPRPRQSSAWLPKTSKLWEPPAPVATTTRRPPDVHGGRPPSPNLYAMMDFSFSLFVNSSSTLPCIAWAGYMQRLLAQAQQRRHAPVSLNGQTTDGKARSPTVASARRSTQALSSRQRTTQTGES